MRVNYSGIVFEDTVRRQQLQNSRFNGIDYIEVDTTTGDNNQRLLRVYFITPGKEPPENKVETMLNDLDDNIEAFSILGGDRVRNIRIKSVIRVENHLELKVDRPGDFSDYRLLITYEGGTPPDDFPLDLFYREVTFNFKAGCPSRFDCHQPLTAPPEPETDIVVDYMAKDYDSFRQALVDLLPRLIPDWSERRVADQGMMLLELLAYVGDHLSYYQDAVANEAFLETARQRISVRRHARLIDYHMHEGLSARTVVQIQMAENAGMKLDAPAGGDRIVRIMTRPQGMMLPNLIPQSHENDALNAAGAIFEINVKSPDTLLFHEKLNELPLYNWGNQIAYLPTGATQADISGDFASPSDWQLCAGDLLILEELLDPYTGKTLTADPNRRHLVRLIKVETMEDSLATLLPESPASITRVYWAQEDALPFRIWISNITDEGISLEAVSVGRGNLAIADEGRTYGKSVSTSGASLDETYPHTLEEYYPHPPDPADWKGFELGQRAFRFTLNKGPLAYSIPLDRVTDAPASALYENDPQQAQPAIHSIQSYTESTYPDRPRKWRAVPATLLNSDRFAEDVVVETDNLGRAQLRFGNNEYGAIPDNNSVFNVRYRFSSGAQGNIGADKLNYIVLHKDIGTMSNIASVRNPLPAWGGSPPESMEQVRRLAPAAMRASPRRAVTEDDYAGITELHPLVASAVAQFRWTGSWQTVFIRVDPRGTTGITPELRADLVRHVSAFTMTGYDLEIIAPIYIPLELSLEICVEPGYFPSDVERGVREVLSNRPLPGGRLGFFHPDQFTFGQRLYISKIYAAVETLKGVQSATIIGLHRQYAIEAQAETEANLARGYIEIGEFAVGRLDNDPDFPENGILHLTMLGGNA
jgi:hypothetical protein